MQDTDSSICSAFKNLLLSQALSLPECKYLHLINAFFLSCVKSLVFGETTSTDILIWFLLYKKNQIPSFGKRVVNYVLKFANIIVCRFKFTYVPFILRVAVLQ